jgi:predicted dehydrogenase
MARIGIVGTGWGARVQVPTFREAGWEVVGIAGSQAVRTRSVAAELGARPFDDWRGLIGSADVELVSIVTPPSEHHDIAIAALEAGKHVLCEKPTAMNTTQAVDLVRAATAHHDRITLIDHELRFLPSWREGRRRIAEIGPVRYAEGRYASPARGDRSRGWNWWSDAGRGGGIWGAVGSHSVDALRYFGLEPESAQAFLATIISERPFEGGTRSVTADDWSVVHLRMHDHSLAVLTFSAVASGPDEAATLTLHGERGAMRFTGEELLLSTGGSPFERVAGGPLEKRPGNSAGGAFGTGTLRLALALRATLDDGDRSALAPAATFEDGLVQQRILDAARESSRSGGWVTV